MFLAWPANFATSPLEHQFQEMVVLVKCSVADEAFRGDAALR